MTAPLLAVTLLPLLAVYPAHGELLFKVLKYMEMWFIGHSMYLNLLVFHNYLKRLTKDEPMKNKLAMLLAFVMMLTVSACNADEAAINARNSLRTAKVTYEMAMEASVELHKADKLTDEQMAKVNEAAVIFVDVYLMAVDALDTYVTTNKALSEQDLAAAVDAVTDGLNVFIKSLVQLGVDIKSELMLRGKP